MAYKIVGINENSEFPPRVEDRLRSLFDGVFTKAPVYRLWNGSSYPARIAGTVNIFFGPVNPGLLMSTEDYWANPDTTTLSTIVSQMRDTSSELHNATKNAVAPNEIYPQIITGENVTANSYGGGETYVYGAALPKGGTNSVRWNTIIPAGWNTATLEVAWVSRQEGAARLSFSFSQADETGIQTRQQTTSNMTSAGALKITYINWSSRVVQAEKSISGTVSRLSDNVGDTITDDIGILSVRLKRIS